MDCTLSLLSEARSFNEVEAIVCGLIRKKVVQAVLAHLGHLDRKLMTDRPAGLRSVGLRSRVLATRFGEITLRRRCYADGQTGRLRYLLDERLGLEPRDRFSEGMKAEAVDQAGRESFRKSSAAYGKTFSHTAVHRWLWDLGAACRRELDRRRRQVFSAGRAIEFGGRVVAALFCEADGVLVHLQREAPRFVEAKLAIIHEGWEKLHPSSREHRLKEKMVYAAVQGATVFWESFSVLAARQWDLSVVKVLAGDGADWIKTGLPYFAGAVYQLCRFHLARKARECLSGLGQALERVWRARHDASRLLAEAQNAVAAAVDPEAREGAEEFLGYLLANRGGLEDYRRRVAVPGVELRGLGAIESNVDKLISGRMKKRGMSWRLEGARNMLAVLTLQANGGFWAAAEAAWGSRQEQEPRPVRHRRVQGSPGIRSVHMPALDSSRPPSELLRSITRQRWPLWPY